MSTSAEVGKQAPNVRRDVPTPAPLTRRESPTPVADWVAVGVRVRAVNSWPRVRLVAGQLGTITALDRIDVVVCWDELTASYPQGVMHPRWHFNAELGRGLYEPVSK